MSLKKFHIIFIMISCLFMIYFSYWSINKWINYSDNSYLFYFVLSFFALLGLILYSKKFINKYKGIVS
ncbi:MAG: hypothetical protein CMG64_04255 [Candidatus Marinimicrobia bacterium]|nr:hypothetical protein [Candidatus Neomarinimicrobiota bacterium]